MSGPDGNAEVLCDGLAFLHIRTEHDFSCYKRATILRRIARRLQINAVETLPDYLSFLRTHPGEAGALLQELLISVTNFFRDREVFAALEAPLTTELCKLTAGDRDAGRLSWWICRSSRRKRSAHFVRVPPVVRQSIQPVNPLILPARQKG